MTITILDDYQNIISKLKCFSLLNNQDVQIINTTEKDLNRLAQQIKNTDILVLTRERTAVDGTLLSLLPRLKLISQTGRFQII